MTQSATGPAPILPVLTDDELIHCVFSIDDNYCQHLGVTLASLVANSPLRRLRFHIVHQGVSAENLCRLKEQLSGYDGCKSSFYTFDTRPYEHFRLDGHVSLASYFRLFLTEIIPSDVDKVLYLDADLVILNDIGLLWQVDLSDSLVGAVPDIFANDPELFASSRESHLGSNQRLGLPENYVYFNAGVLSINLSGWRLANIVSRFVEYVELNHDILRFHDQDALNAILRDRVQYISYAWNFQAKTRLADMERVGIDKHEFELLRRNLNIVHFTTGRKPWFYAHEVPYEHEYFRYIRRTSWRNYRPPDRTLRRILGRNLKPLRWVYRRLMTRQATMLR